MATSEAVPVTKVSQSAPVAPKLLSTAATDRRGGGRDDALRQGETAHVGAELAAAEQGERQGGALHRLQSVGDAVGYDADQRHDEVAAGDQRQPQPERQHGRADHGGVHDRVAVAEQQLEQADGDLGRADQRGQQHRRGGGMAEPAQDLDHVDHGAGEHEGAAGERQRQQQEDTRADLGRHAAGGGRGRRRRDDGSAAGSAAPADGWAHRPTGGWRHRPAACRASRRPGRARPTAARTPSRRSRR